MELIDREKVMSTIRAMVELPNEVRAQVLGAISRAKTVDAVEVVRCKDCKFCRTFFPEKEIGKEARQVWYCNLYRCSRKTDEYCSDGERREEA